MGLGVGDTHGCMGIGVLRDGNTRIWGFGVGGTHGCMGMWILRDGGSRIWGWGHPWVPGSLLWGHIRPPPPPFPPLWAQVLQVGRFSAVWRGTLQQRPVAIKAFAEGAARRWAAERAVHELPLMEHENVAKLLGTRGAGPCARGGLLVLQLYPAVSAGRGDGG